MVASDARIRIGIDVGGTFTHAVAVASPGLALVGKVRTPTTHRAVEGVARGIVESLLMLLQQADIHPDQVAMIAHSTTQATNALLEGDVAPVGIIGMGDGTGALIARRQTAIKPIPLTRTRQLRVHHRFIASSRVNEATVGAAIDQLREQGAEVIVAAEAFSVDDPTNEDLVCREAAARGLPATATHQVSQLHGLGIRTRTAAINASMAPTMLATANMTERAVREAGIRAPVMIMRSDGGIMDIVEMRRRPILTMLSGPAAGVAAALLYARISDGIFLEVGGTSTDISVIKNGRTQVRSAEVGGKRLFVNTLDVRTIGVAGGSLVCLDGNRIEQVGPRSAHIAGLPYLSFAEVEADRLRPARREDNGEHYLTLSAGDEEYAVTTTCAGNFLGLVPEGDPAHGRNDLIRVGLDRAAVELGIEDASSLADVILTKACSKAERVVDCLIEEYRLDREVIRLAAGGGGGSAIVPFLAGRMGLPFETVENADVISAIGVALALVRDTVERTAISPTDEEIRRVRAEAFERVLRMGAAADTIEVYVEVDATRNLLRATAEGSLDIRQRDLRPAGLDIAARRQLATVSIGAGETPAELSVACAGFEVWAAERFVPRFWRFLRKKRIAVRALDSAGTIRWASNHADWIVSSVGRVRADLARFVETHTRYSDAGATIPRCYVLLGSRIIDLSGLVELHQVLGVLESELTRYTANEECIAMLDLGAGVR